MRTLTILAIIVVISLIGGVIGYNINQPDKPVGSVQTASEYKVTTFTATTTTMWTFKTEPGTLGSVIINTINTGNVRLYDATTTNVNLRVGATSTMKLIGTIDTNQAVGVYTYDVAFNDGLIATFGGTQGTSTVTWR